MSAVVSVDGPRSALRRAHALGGPQLRPAAGRVPRRARPERHRQDVADPDPARPARAVGRTRARQRAPAARRPAARRLRAAAARLRPRPRAARARPRAARARRPSLGHRAALDATSARASTARSRASARATTPTRRSAGCRAASSSACGSRRPSSRIRRSSSRTSRCSRSTSRTSTRSPACSTSAGGRAGTPVLFVTHDINPVLGMVDRVLYLAPGQLGDRSAGRGAHLGDALAALRHRRRRPARARPHRRRRHAGRPARPPRRPRALMFTDLLAQHFVHTALLAGAVVAVVSGAIGIFVVTRGASFAVHAISELGFTGAAGALVVGHRPGDRDDRRLARRRARARRALAARPRARQRDRRGARVRARRRRPLPLALPRATRPRRRTCSSAASSASATASCSSSSIVALIVAAGLAALYRPLLFSSVDPEVAAARGVPLRALSIAIFLLLALTTAEAIQVVGVLLVLTLVITPAAAAQRLTARPGFALVLSIADRARRDRGRDPALARAAVADELLHQRDLVRGLRRGARSSGGSGDGAHVRPRGARPSRCPGSAASPASGRAASGARTPGSRSPSPSGLHGMNAMPSASHASSTSSEMSRPRLYSFCTETMRATDCAARSCSTETFETPISRILPSSPQLVERADRLLDRHLGIVAVQLVEVDALELQPAQARVARAPQVLGPPVADAVLQPVAEPALRRDHEARPDTGAAPPRRPLRSPRRRRCRRCRSSVTPSSTARRTTRTPSSRSSTMRIAPKPSRRTSSSPPSMNVGFTGPAIGFAPPASAER